MNYTQFKKLVNAGYGLKNYYKLSRSTKQEWKAYFKDRHGLTEEELRNLNENGVNKAYQIFAEYHGVSAEKMLKQNLSFIYYK